MTIEELFKRKPTYIYSEVGESTTLNFTLEEIKSIIESFNEDFNTNYKTINEFNDGENYRKIEIQL